MPNAFEDFGAKGAGKVKGAIAGLKGLTGVFNTLAQEHGEVSALLKRAKASREPPKRLELWKKIRTELLSHERAELGVVFPVLRDFDATRAYAEEHDREAGELELTIQEVDRFDPGSDSWLEGLDQLIRLVEHHVDREENHIFPAAVDVIDKERSDELNQHFLARKEAIAEQLR